MAKPIDKEIEAIKAVLDSLEPLTPEARISVIEYAIKRFQIDLGPVQTRDVFRTFEAVADEPSLEPEPAPAPEQSTASIHIKEFKEKKKPRSNNEMATLVAYYLANEAEPADRKDKITAKDIETYFKIADFRLPEKKQFTLPNARAAGYLDAVGNGEYKLNAVGHNLIVHSMPRGAGGTAAPRRRPAKKKAKPAAKKKAKPTAKKKAKFPTKKK